MKRSIFSRIAAFAICLLMAGAMIPAIPAHAAITSPDLTVKSAGDTAVVTWTPAGNSDEVYYYLIYRAKEVSGAAGKFVCIQEWTPEDGLEYEDYDVKVATKYYYKVEAYNIDGKCVAVSDVESILVPLSKAIVHRVVHDAATGNPQLCIAIVDKADRYYVFRSKCKTGTYTKVGSTTTDKYTDKNLAAGVTYYYKVQAIYDADKNANSKLSGYTTAKKVKAEPALASAIKNSLNSNGKLVNIATLDKSLRLVSKVGIDSLFGFDGGPSALHKGKYTRADIFDLSKIKAAGGTVYDTGMGLGDLYYSQSEYIIKKNGINYNMVTARSYGLNLVRVSKDSTKTEINTFIESIAKKYYPTSNWTITSSKYSSQTATATVRGMKEWHNTMAKKAGYGSYTANSYYLQLKNKNNGKKGWTFVTVVPTLTRLSKPAITISNLSGTPDMKVSWKKVSGASKYEVWKKVGTNGTYKKVKTTTSLSYRDKSTVKGKKYYYKVKAIKTSNSTQNSYFSGAKYLTCK